MKLVSKLQRIQWFSGLPLQEYELMLLVTKNCPADCSICYLDADMKQTETMNLEEIKSYIRVAGAYGCSHLVLTGGEPFLFKEKMLEATRYGKNLGFFVDIRTNGFWARNYVKTLGLLAIFQKAGLDRLGISFDKFHNKIPKTFTKNALRACKELGISIYIDCVDKHAKKDSTASKLNVDLSQIRSCIPPVRLGRALGVDSNEFQKVKWEYFRPTCGKGASYGLSLYISPGGETSLHECCWGNPALYLGNVKLAQNRMHFIFECLEKRYSHPVYNFLMASGPRGLVKLALDVCPEQVFTYYSGECEACFNLLSEPKIVNAVFELNKNEI
jgi:MoaA/NifB/PqqE/SkfB family radical SAM enzyme